MMWQPGDCIALAKQCGYSIEQHQEKSCLLIAVKRGVQVNIYYSTRTVGTSMKHPTKGKTQLFRRHCSLGALEQILNNPRVHTGKGYYTT